MAVLTVANERTNAIRSGRVGDHRRDRGGERGRLQPRFTGPVRKPVSAGRILELGAGYGALYLALPLVDRQGLLADASQRGFIETLQLFFSRDAIRLEAIGPLPVLEGLLCVSAPFLVWRQLVLGV